MTNTLFFEKNYFFDSFFRSGGAPGLLREYRGLLRSEKIMQIIGFMMKKTCIRKEMKSPYFGDQKCDVQNPQNRCRIQKIKNQKNRIFPIFGPRGWHTDYVEVADPDFDPRFCFSWAPFY